MSERTLVGELFDGPIDIVGDVHGEVGALHELRRRLGYDERGRHPQGRRLVFVGDLGDRGPDSPGAIEWIGGLIDQGRAQAVLGNHDLNALLAAHAGGPMKTELSWLFDEARPFHHHHHHVPQTLVRGRRRDDVLAVFARLPVVLERGGEAPVRVTHACWAPAEIDRLRSQSDVVAFYVQERDRIRASLAVEPANNPLDEKLRYQNDNPVKRITSGPEGRSIEPILINNEPRYEVRLPWWRDYHDQTLCVFGHYWRIPLPGETRFEHLFEGCANNALLGPGACMCIDYSVGKRFKERMRSGFGHRYLSSLGALRLPERVLIFDNQESLPLLSPEAGGKMNRTEWLACQYPMLMLPAVRERAGDRKLRLLACAACRRLGERFNAHQVALLEQAELEADRQDGARCINDTRAATAALRLTSNAPAGAWHVVLALFEESGWNAARGVLERIDEMLILGGVDPTPGSSFLAEQRWQADIVRDLFDDLFHPPLHLAWVEDHAHLIGLARTIYEERSWSELSILADALEEAGCTDERLLEHCRENRPHARGCWVLDGVLGRI